MMRMRFTGRRQRGASAEKKPSDQSPNAAPKVCGQVSKVTTEEIHRLRTSFALLERQANVAALIFYRRLFALDPSLRVMFREDIELQARSFMDTLATLVASLDRTRAVEELLAELGERHAGFGVRPDHYPVVGAALEGMLADVLGPALTLEVRAAWSRLYSLVTESMLRGAARVQLPGSTTPPQAPRTSAAAR